MAIDNHITRDNAAFGRAHHHLVTAVLRGQWKHDPMAYDRSAEAVQKTFTKVVTLLASTPLLPNRIAGTHLWDADGELILADVIPCSNGRVKLILTEDGGPALLLWHDSVNDGP